MEDTTAERGLTATPRIVRQVRHTNTPEEQIVLVNLLS
ncbi:hypothetical protein IEO21_02420 [Rhodonia placenta]|uniref:Uncharacterized protein n=1 Tax=Rhodonia placenta TaxID=104341 RepID=A0A8H7U4K3_9APHY|nr:hypothetical protein IEO21_02420 [Postia placenta]